MPGVLLASLVPQVTVADLPTAMRAALILQGVVVLAGASMLCRRAPAVAARSRLAVLTAFAAGGAGYADFAVTAGGGAGPGLLPMFYISTFGGLALAGVLGRSAMAAYRGELSAARQRRVLLAGVATALRTVLDGRGMPVAAPIERVDDPRPDPTWSSSAPSCPSPPRR